ncbi:glycosyltransferase family 4 protein [soil metagenome]
MNVLVLHSQVPFVRGGAEVLVEGLVHALSVRGHTVDTVALPLSWNPTEGLLTTALNWRLLDVSSFNGRGVDCVICTKYPTWAVQHSNKALWLIHQHRQAYDLYGTPLSEFTPDKASRAVRERVIEIDRRGIQECARRFSISNNVRDRLKKYSGIDAKALYPPVPRDGLKPDSYEPFVLSASRIDGAKRVDRLVQAWEHVTSDLKLVIVGDGPDIDKLRSTVRTRGLTSRIEILGRVDDDHLRGLFNHCRAVYYAPVDEDYGYAAVEALTAGKPVITAPDSGGVLEFVSHEHFGLVTSLDPRPLAATVDRLSDESFARVLGIDGPTATRNMTWDTVVKSLLGA